MFNIDFWFVFKFQGIRNCYWIHVSNKFFMSLARPTNWVSTEVFNSSELNPFYSSGLYIFF